MPVPSRKPAILLLATLLPATAAWPANDEAENPSLMGRVLSLMQKMMDSCNDPEVRYLFFAERPLPAGEAKAALARVQ